MSTFFLELISILDNDMYFLFLLFLNTCHNHELVRVNETLEKLSKHQNL